MKFKDFVLRERTEGKTYSYSSSQIDLPQEISERIYQFGLDNVPKSKLDEKDGRQKINDIHCTLKFGYNFSDYKLIEPFIKLFNPFKIRLGKISLFKKPDQDVVKIEVEKTYELMSLNKFLTNNTDNVETFPNFDPHVTIAFSKPNECNNLIGDSTFEGEEILVNVIMFSNTEGIKTPIYFQDIKPLQIITHKKKVPYYG